jgi:hypothetical protein
MAATVVYEHPVAGGTAPTAVQAKEQVTFTINDVVTADSALIVTHNMGLSTADLAAGLPIVVLQPLRASARTAQWIIGSAALPGATGKTANAIQLTKVSTTGSDTGTAVAQIRVHLIRPHTIGR